MRHYEEVLEELKSESSKLAKAYVPKLYDILREEELLSSEDSRAKVERDCEKIWALDTIRKYLPPEAKNAVKRKAGKISVDVKKKRKEKKQQPKLLAAAIATQGGQYTMRLCSKGDDEINDYSVGMNPTENGSVWQKEQELGAFQRGTDTQQSDNAFSEDYYFYLILVPQRLLEEFEEITEYISLEELLTGNLYLPSELAEQICLDVIESSKLGTISDFELECEGKRIISVRNHSDDGKLE